MFRIDLLESSELRVPECLDLNKKFITEATRIIGEYNNDILENKMGNFLP